MLARHEDALPFLMHLNHLLLTFRAEEACPFAIVSQDLGQWSPPPPGHDKDADIDEWKGLM